MSPTPSNSTNEPSQIDDLLQRSDSTKDGNSSFGSSRELEVDLVDRSSGMYDYIASSTYSTASSSVDSDSNSNRDVDGADGPSGSMRSCRALGPKSSREKLREFSCEQLHFDRIGLAGRSDEVRIMDDVLQSHFVAMPPPATKTAHKQLHEMDTSLHNGTRRASLSITSRRSLVLLAGSSGSGKSALAQQLRPKVRRQRGLFVYTKFDLRRVDHQMPLEGVKSALNDICSSIMHLKQKPSANDIHCGGNPRASSAGDKFKLLQHAIMAGLDADALGILSANIANLIDIINVHNDEEMATADAPHGARHIRRTNSSRNRNRFVPDAHESVGTSTSTNRKGQPILNSSLHDSNNSLSIDMQADQLKFIISRFFQIVTSIIPIVWVLDDLQWADAASMDTIQRCLLDGRIRSMMVVGAYRSNEVSDLLEATLEEIDSCKQPHSLRVECINVGDLAVDDVQQILVQLLNPKSADTVDELSAIIHSKTHGNALFVQHFIRMLVDQDLLCYNVGMSKWTWNEKHVQQQTDATKNVLDLLMSKLQHLEAARHVLPLMACLGNSCHESMVRMALEGFSDHSGQSRWFEVMFGTHPSTVAKNLRLDLEMCQRNGLIVQQGRDMSNPLDESDGATKTMRTTSSMVPTPESSNALLSFVHDKVQEAALKLLAADKLPELKFRIGKMLLESMTEKELRLHTFVTVNLINNRLDLLPGHIGARCNPIRSKASTLNYYAGRHAMSCVSCKIAAQYFQNAIDLMPNDHWSQRHMNHSVEVYIAAAECAFINADMMMLEKYAKAVQNSACSKLDKLRVYHLMIGTSRTVKHRDETSFNPIMFGLNVLRGMGSRIPEGRRRQKLATLKGLIGLSSKVKQKWAPALLHTLKYTTNKEALAYMMTLDRLVDACFQDRPDLLPLLLIDGVRKSFEVGLTPWSGPAFAGLANLVLARLNDVQTATAYANYAATMVESMENHEAKNRTLIVASSRALSWDVPFSQLLKKFSDIHDASMSAGDLNNAIWAAFMYTYVGLHTGHNLNEVYQDHRIYLQLTYGCELARQEEKLNVLDSLVRRLLGQPYEPKDQSSSDSLLRSRHSQSAGESAKALRHRCLRANTEVVYASYMADYVTAADLAVKYFEGVMRLFMTHAASIFATFFAGFSCYAAIADSAKQREKKNKYFKQYRKLAQKCRAKLEEWTSRGCPNTAHLLDLVNAEWLSLKGDTTLALQCFQDSIRSSARRGQINIQAIGNERLAEFHIRDGEAGDARYYFEEALRLNKEWGATTKVKALEERCDMLEIFNDTSEKAMDASTSE